MKVYIVIEEWAESSTKEEDTEYMVFKYLEIAREEMKRRIESFRNLDLGYIERNLPQKDFFHAYKNEDYECEDYTTIKIIEREVF